MSESGRFKRFLEKTGYVLDCIVLAALFIVAVGILVQTLQKDIPRIHLHKALAIGFAAFFLLFLIPRVRKNTQWTFPIVAVGSAICPSPFLPTVSRSSH